MLPRCRAFTLIELALVLVIVSLMTGFGMQAVESTSSVNCYEDTQAQLATIDSALKDFIAKNNRLPKPAYMNRGSNSPEFGVEAKGGGTPSSAAYATLVPAGMNNTGGVLFGALPHATLGLPAQYAADCWGDKFVYTVENSQTSSDATVGYPSANLGTITVNAGTLGAPLALTTEATYVVLSNGQDKYGANPLTANDTTHLNCNGSTEAKIDRENCDVSNKTLFNAMRNTGTTSSYFDDMVVYSAKRLSTEDCAAQTVNWNSGGFNATPCTSGMAALTHEGAPLVLTNTNPLYTGSITVDCNDGVLVPSAISCVAAAPCPSQAVNWPTGCSGTSVGSIASGNSQTVNNSAANKYGSVSVLCTNGVLSQSGASCNTPPACTGATVTWLTNCSAAVGGMALNASTSGVNNTASGYTGTTTVTCQQSGPNSSTSSFVTSSDVCNIVPPSPCASQVVTWGGGCSATAGALAHGGTQAVTNVAAGRSGSGTATCSNGTTTATGSCYLDCAAGTRTWNTNCSSTYSAIAHGGTSALTNTNPGYTGANTITCTNGVISDAPSASCTLTPTGGPGNLYCWGKNSYGSLGDGTGTQRLTPVATQMPPSVSLISGSPGTSGQWSSFTCGLGNNGRAYCWGVNAFGQLGDGTTTQHSLPTAVTLPGGVTSFTAVSTGGDGNNGADHACGIGNDGHAYCWGSNIAGQIGDGTTTQRLTPTLVTQPGGTTSFTAIAAGAEHNCAIANTGNIYCWGLGTNGQLGNGASTSSSTPVLATLPGGVTSWTAVTAGRDLIGSGHTCAIANTGAAYCWGRNSNGQIGDNSTTNRAVPTAVTMPGGGVTFVKISADNRNTCAIGSNGRAYCWGDNGAGQIGDGTTTQRLIPTIVTLPGGVTSFTSIATGGVGTYWSGSGWVNHGYACAVGNNGKAYCWGANPDGNLGDGNSSGYAWVPAVLSTTPTQVTDPYAGAYFSQIWGGSDHTCAMTAASAPGTCGASNGGSFSSAPSSGLCATGTPSAVTGSGPYNWDCSGTLCSANRSCTASSVTWNTNCSVSMGAQNHGYSGSQTNTAGGYTGTATVTCTQGVWGSSGGSCSASAGTCGASNGGNFASAPSSGLCSSGTPSAVTGSGPYSWDCSGTACSANRSCSAATVTWNTNCSVSMGAQNHAYSGSQTNTAGGYTGSATVSCTQGVWGTSGGSCTSSSSNLYCWGQNVYLPLGTGAGNTTTSTMAVGGQNFTSVANQFTAGCGVNGAGAAYCWGSTALGITANTPTALGGGITFKPGITYGADGHMCGLNLSGAAYCAGPGTSGQLGNGASSTSTTPVAVSGGNTFIDIASSYGSTCGLTNWDIMCWGLNDVGQLGNGTATNYNTPVTVTGSSGSYLDIGGGYNFFCAAKNTGALYCWGSGFGYAPSNVPVVVPGPFLTSLTDGGYYHMCGLNLAGEAYCWGPNNFYGQQGDGTTGGGGHAMPTKVVGGHKFRSLSAHGYTTCGIELNGSTYCWGHNSNGQLGEGTTTNNGTPQLVSGGLSYTTSGAGYFTACAIKNTGTGTCGASHGSVFQTAPGSGLCSTGTPSAVSGSDTTQWNWDCSGTPCLAYVANTTNAYSWGQAMSQGDGSLSVSRFEATPVLSASGPLTFTQLGKGDGFHQCALTGAGAAYCWGYNSNGSAGIGVASSYVKKATAVSGGLTFSKISTAWTSSTCGLTTGGTPYCWGLNAGVTNTTPAIKGGGLTYTEIAAGENHVCGITNTGAAYCWGNNADGELGNGTNTSSATPVLVSGGLTFSKIVTAGYNSTHSTCALTTAGQAYCWGHYAWMGSGAYVNSNVPVAVTGGHTFTKIQAGGFSVCALKSNGDEWCWGFGDLGELGDGAFTNFAVNPVQVVMSPPAGTYFVDMASQTYGNCALDTGGTAYCWGRQMTSDYAMGNGSVGNTNYASPGSAVHSDVTFTAIGGAYAGGSGIAGTPGGGICGAAAGGNTTSAPSSGLCSSGTPSAVTGSGPYNWDCSGTPCTSNRSCSVQSLTWNTNCSASQSAQNHGYSASLTNTAGGYTGTVTATCTQGTWGTSGGSCSASAGVCGTSNGGDFTSAPSSGLCASGTPSAVTGTGPYNWTCSGTACSANRGCAAAFYTATWTSGSNTCNNQTSWSAQAHGWSQSVNGTYGSSSANTALIPDAAGGTATVSCNQGNFTTVGSSCTVVGRCGSAHLGTTASAPSSSLCAVGTPGSVTWDSINLNMWGWTCGNGSSATWCWSFKSCGTGGKFMTDAFSNQNLCLYKGAAGASCTATCAALGLTASTYENESIMQSPYTQVCFYAPGMFNPTTTTWYAQGTNEGAASPACTVRVSGTTSYFTDGQPGTTVNTTVDGSRNRICHCQ